MASYSEQELDAVWANGKKIPGYNPDKVRQDACGARIYRDQYDNRQSIYGWQVDHIRLKSDGGSDEIENLRPLQWQNNEARQEGPLVYKVVAVGDANIEVERLIGRIVRQELTKYLQKLSEEE